MKNIEKIFLLEEESTLTISSPEEMRHLGQRIAACLEPSDVIGLVGDLGAGKTHLVQGILKGLGAQDVGASPTFSLVHEHHDTRLPVAHFDFYRMEDEAEAMGIDWDGFLQSESVLLVEWADRFDGKLLPSDTHWIILKHKSEETRSLSYHYDES